MGETLGLRAAVALKCTYCGRALEGPVCGFCGRSSTVSMPHRSVTAFAPLSQEARFQAIEDRLAALERPWWRRLWAWVTRG